MNAPSTTPYDDAQRIVLRGAHWAAARYLVLTFTPQAQPRRLLHLLMQRALWPAAAGPERSAPAVQIALGLSRRGLQRLAVPRHVLAAFALKAPAFHAGAALRASRHLGAAGADAPARWSQRLRFDAVDAVVSVHGNDAGAVADAADRIAGAARDAGVDRAALPPGLRLPEPSGENPVDGASWTHFGFRDGLSHVGIRGWPGKPGYGGVEHAAGEFLLGHPQDSGANPWIAGPGRRVWPEALRPFFRNGSFGVLHLIRQHADAFDDFVAAAAHSSGLSAADVKAKLCGRHTDGRPLGAARGSDVEADFDYVQDPHGHICPFGAHVRRMNPRDAGLAHGARSRPLLRRGMAYGPPWVRGDADEKSGRGLVGHFFCASIEDQYEHLVGRWAARGPLGSEARGGARDPLFGAHEVGDGAFEIPRAAGQPPIRLMGLPRFTQTRGIAYLFYPSLTALRGIADHSRWHVRDEDEG